MTALDVYLHEDRAGTLERLEGARLRFTYDPSWLTTAAMPLSLSLPLTDDPYTDEDCRPFFAGLLLEGDFLKAIARAFAIGNADAHSKNYSLLLEGPGAPRLAPLYDLISTRAYGRRFDRKMGMKYGGEYRPDRIRGRHLDHLGEALGIAPRRVREHAKVISEAALRSRAGARERLGEPWREEPILDSVDETIELLGGVLAGAAAESL